MTHKNVVVNHWGIWVCSNDPITGVVQNNRVMYLGEELQDGIDLAFEQHISECELCQNDVVCGFIEYWECDSSNILIGDWIKDENDLWDYDPEGEYAAICGEIYTQVIYSKTITRCALCSPCYPGQGDIDSPGDFLAYCLPWELYGEEDDVQFLMAQEEKKEKM